MTVSDRSFADVASSLSEVVARLAMLPEDPDDIAAVFKASGIKGVQCNSHACAVTAYLTNGLDPSVWVSTDREFVNVEVGGHEMGLKTPWPVSNFIHKFDYGDYPDLVAP